MFCAFHLGIEVAFLDLVKGAGATGKNKYANSSVEEPEVKASRINQVSGYSGEGNGQGDLVLHQGKDGGEFGKFWFNRHCLYY